VKCLRRVSRCSLSGITANSAFLSSPKVSKKLCKHKSASISLSKIEVDESPVPLVLFWSNQCFRAMVPKRGQSQPHLHSRKASTFLVEFHPARGCATQMFQQLSRQQLAYIFRSSRALVVFQSLIQIHFYQLINTGRS
jgi:hypothetical protein